MGLHSISLTDGVTTVNLNSIGGHATLDYEMGVPDSDKSGADYEPEITETITVMLAAATGPLLQVAINSVENLLILAKRRQMTLTGPRVYLQLQVDGEASAWRAEILNGEFHPDKDMLKIGWPNLRAEGALMVTHRAWEGPRKELQLSSFSSPTPATGGKPITNGTATNYVQVAGTQVGGVLPTPVELQLTNTAGSSVAYQNFYLATNASSDPTNFTHMIEGEACQITYRTVTANADCSNGNYNAYGFTNNGEIRWDLSSALMQDTQGRDFLLLVRFFSWSGTGLYIQPRLLDSNGNIEIATGDEYRLDVLSSGSKIVNLGSLPLPNGNYYTSYAATVLSFKLRATGAGTCNVDFIQLTPLSDKSYQYIVQRGYTIANNGTVTFDNIEGVFHAGGNNIYSPRAGKVRVWPGLTQRILILHDEGPGGSVVARTMTVRAFIRERRLTV